MKKNVTRAIVLICGLGLAVSASASLIINNGVAARIDDFADYGANTGDGTDLLNAGGSSSMICGDYPTVNPVTARLFTPVIEFDIDAYRTQIDSASSVLLKLKVTQIYGAPGDMRVFDMDDTDENGVMALADVDGGTSVATFNGASYGVGEWVTIDITSSIKADSANLLNNYAGFRIVLDPLTDNLNSTLDGLKFGTVGTVSDNIVVEVIPEPVTLSLLGGGIGFLMLLRRRFTK